VALLLIRLGGARIGDTWGPMNLSEDYLRYRAQLGYAREEYPREAKNVCDIIVCQAKERFSCTSHLIAPTFFFPEKYKYSNCFPEKKFQETIKVYPFFNEQKLRTELTVIYETKEFRSISSLLVLHDFMAQNNELSATFRFHVFNKS
jgi:hypothetical protein